MTETNRVTVQVGEEIWEFRTQLFEGEWYAFAAYGLSRNGNGDIELADRPRPMVNPLTSVATALITTADVHDALSGNDRPVPEVLIKLTELPTSATGLPVGTFWLNAGVLAVAS